MDEFLQDAAEDARTVKAMRAHLPQELQDRLDDDALYYFLDVLVEYYADSDILDAEPDAEGFVTVDVDAIAADILGTVQKEGYSDLTAEDLAFIVEAHLEAEEEAQA
ncbi:MAG: hypothetical protein IJ692_01875 [Alloprevotella sp.]|nr:hypothetical protein [Alloprevotella sp.]MBR1652121.1 hypothetical protein [Alloprevotella sp.]